jgi:hypothetical protein
MSPRRAPPNWKVWGPLGWRENDHSLERGALNPRMHQRHDPATDKLTGLRTAAANSVKPAESPVESTRGGHYKSTV